MNAGVCDDSTQSAPALSLRIVTDANDLLPLASAWQELLEASAAPQPMCAPNWLITWWQVYGRSRQLRFGLFHEGDRLVGLAPLCRRTYWYRPGIPFRRLEFLGSDVDENDGVCSEYLNLIIRKGYEPRVLQSFVPALEGGAFGSWDECVLSAMDRDNDLTGALTRALSQLDAQVETTATGVSPYLKLPASWEEFLQRFHKKKRQSLTYALRDFHAWAGADWNLHVAETPEQLTEGLQILTILHRERWQAEGQFGAFDSPRFQQFHERYSRLALEQRQLMLLWVAVRGVPVAALYAFVANGRAYFYQCGRTLTAPSKVRLGIVMVILALQEAMARGLAEFDFLGGEAQYKSLFTSDERPLCRVRVARRGLPEWSRTLARKTLHLARALRDHGASLLICARNALARETLTSHLPTRQTS